MSDDAIYLIIPLPFLLALAGVLLWRFTGNREQPMSHKAKIIVATILVWSFLPIIGFLGLWLLAEMGGHMGD